MAAIGLSFELAEFTKRIPAVIAENGFSKRWSAMRGDFFSSTSLR